MSKNIDLRRIYKSGTYLGYKYSNKKIHYKAMLLYKGIRTNIRQTI